MDSKFRKLNTRERDLLKKLLAIATSGRDELRSQVNDIKGKQIREDGTLLLRCISGSPFRGYTPIAEGVFKDADGSDIAVILHLKAGFMSMLEIIKYDGSQVINQPTAENLVMSSVPKFEVP